jgi:hypothetical protein
VPVDQNWTTKEYLQEILDALGGSSGAAAAADDTANPTAGATRSFPHVWSVVDTGWNRMREIPVSAQTGATGFLGVGLALHSPSNDSFIAAASSVRDNESRNRILAAIPYMVSGASCDGLVDANNAAGTTGDGVPASGGMGHDGTNWRRLLCDSTGTPRTGRHLTAVKLALTVQAAAYAANDLVGGKLTFTSAVRVSGGSGIIRGIVIGDQAANSAANSVYDLIFFDSDPSGTTFTENAALDVADADLNKIIAVERFDGVAGSTLFTNADNQVVYLPTEIPIQTSGSTSLFGALIARGAPTYAATTDVFVTLLIEQN